MSRFYTIHRNAPIPRGEGARGNVFVEHARICDGCDMKVTVTPPWAPDFDPTLLTKWGLLEGADERHPLFDFCPACLDEAATILRNFLGVGGFRTNLDDLVEGLTIEKNGISA